MIKKVKSSQNNISQSVEFVLKCSQKRRSLAIASAKMLNSEMGISQKLIALS